MSIVNRTAVVVPVSAFRFTHLPLISDNALHITNASDYVVLPTTWLWGSKWTCFFKANIFSTPNSAARLMSNDSEEIILTVTGIKVVQGGSNIQSGAGVLTLNEWHDYAIVYDGKFVRFYRDMAPIDAKALTTNPSTNAWGWVLFNNPAHTRQCDMDVTRFQFYSNRAFSPEEVVAHYRSKPNDTANMALYLKLNEGTDINAIDSSGNGRNATIAGCSWTTFKLPNAISTYGDVSIASIRTST